MWIRVLASTLVGGVWHEPGVGNYEPKLAQFLIDIGSAVAYETKVIENIETKSVKKPKPGSALPPARASRKRTAKKSAFDRDWETISIRN